MTTKIHRKGFPRQRQARVVVYDRPRKQATQEESYRRLAGGVIIQALKDLTSDDILSAADAVSWLLMDGGFYLEVCGLGHLEPGDCLRKILEIGDDNE